MAIQSINIVKHSTILIRSALLVGLFSALFLSQLKATHIVGGQIGYRWVSGNTYEIILDVYRDCSNPANEPFDPTAFVGVYDLQGTWIQNISMPFMGADTLDAILFDECLFVPANICVSRTQYRGFFTISSNPPPGGYRFAYVRCCRNETITNIIDPLESGAVYDIVLTTTAIQYRNSSPRFRSWPPIFICVNNPILYDHSAVDTFQMAATRDSIVYRLCQPLSGGTLARPRPIPPQSPPSSWSDVEWKTPLYGLTNMLGNTGDTSLVLTGCTSSDTIISDSLKINPITGLLTGTPTIQGQFVVGVCADEYIPGTDILLSTTRRDFQYNVGPCLEVAANFDAPSVQCDNLTVQFNSTSTNADEFIWYFNFPSTTPTSTLANPAHTFPDTGRYTVALIVEPLSTCVDTFCQEVRLVNSTLQADFQLDVFDCDTFAVLQLQDRSADSAVQIIQRQWTVTYDTTVLTSTQQNPRFNLPLGVSGTVRLTVINANTCTETFQANFQTGLDNPGSYINANLSACNGDTLFLNPDTPPGISFGYEWSPTTGLIDPSNTVNPRIIAGLNSAYSVTITAPGAVCQIVRTVTIASSPLPVLDFDTTADCDGLTINFNNTSTGATAFEWNFGDPNNPSAGSTQVNPSYTYPEVGTYLVTLKVPDNLSCRDSITRPVTVLTKSLSAEFDVEYASCSPDSVRVRFLDRSVSTGSPIVAWAWDFGNGQTSTQQNPEITLLANADLNVTSTVTAADNCSNTMTKPIAIRLVNPLDFSGLPTQLIRCNDAAAFLPTPLNANYIYQWLPTDGIDDPASNNPVFSPAQTTTYTLRVGAVGTDTCFSTYQLIVVVPPAVELFVSGGGQTCDPQATLLASAEVPVDFVWTNASGEVLSNDNALTVPVSGVAVYTVTATDQFGCNEAQQVQLSGGPVNVTLPPVAAVCLGETLTLFIQNNDPNDTLTYLWTPASAFAPGTNVNAVPDYLEIVGERTVQVRATNQFGCSFEGAIPTAVVDTALQLGFTHLVQCNGATVEFTNTSVNAFNFVWDFGDGNTSTDANPVYTYVTAGTYTVRLTIGYAVSCADTFSQVVNVVNPQIIADFDFNISACNNGSAQVAFFDRSLNSFNNTNQWNWSFSNGQTSNQQNPVITVTQSGPLTATLTINTANNCPATVSRTFDVQLVNINIADSVRICPGGSVALNPSGNPAYQYLWSPAAGLSDPTSPNPIASPAQSTIYTVRIQAFGDDTCSYTQQVRAFVPPAIGLDTPDDAVTCGGPVTLGASSITPTDIVWRNSQGVVLGGPAITVDPFRIETYTATATDVFGCTESASVIVNDQGVDIQATPSGDLNACEDVAFQIRVTNLDTLDVLMYEWEPANLVIAGAGTATPTIMIGASGAAIRGIVTNQFGCTDTVNINVNIVPFNVQIPDTVRICVGEPAGISPGLNPNYQYVWSPTTDLDLSNPSNPIYRGTTGGVYNVTVTDNSNGFFCQTERTVRVLVTPSINLTTTADTTVCQLGAVPLRASASTPATFTWSVSGQTFATGSPVTFNAVQAGTYPVQVIARDNFGCQDTATINVLAVDFQPGPLASPQTVCNNTPTALNPGGNPAYTYTWSPTTDLNLSNPSNPVAVVSGPRTYNITVTEPVGNCSVQRQVQVNTFPAINLRATGDTTVCSLGAHTLSASSQVPATLQWFSAGNPLGTGSQLTITTDAPGDYAYTVIATDDNNCRDTARVDVRVVNFQPGPLASPQTVCANTPTALNPGGNPAYNYIWSPTTGLNLSTPSNPVAVITGPSTYNVTVTDPASGCSEQRSVQANVFPLINLSASRDTLLCEIAPITLAASAAVPVGYRWLLNGNTVGTDVSITVTPAEGNSRYLVIAEDVNGCRDTASVNVSIFLLNTGLLDSVRVCIDAPTPLNPGGNPAYNYVWSPTTGLNLNPPHNPVVTTNVDRTYTVTISDPALGCSIERQIAVRVYPAIQLSTAAEVPVCRPGAQATLTASSAIPSSYAWADDPAFVPVLGTGDIFIVTPPNGASVYYVRATDANGCTEVRPVTVNNFPISATLTPPVVLCVPQNTTTLGVVNLRPDQTLTYDWLPASAVTPPSGNPVVTVNASQASDFGVVLTNQYGCRDTLSTRVTILDLPSAVRLNVNPPQILLGESSQLEVTGCTDCTYLWSPAESLNNPFARNPVASPERTTEYSVVVSKDGCSVTLRGTVTVNYLCEEPYIFFPTAFTPNGDGQNDVLRVRARPALVLDVNWVIYNRWGQKIFEGKSLNDEWDGTFKGKELPPDVYGYYLVVSCPGGQKFEKKGNVTLLR